MHAEDAIYEHVVHNILFPNTRYVFIGISEIDGDMRIILSQAFCNAEMWPTDEEISSFLENFELKPENHYYFGNEYLAITDVAYNSDNVLKDEHGELFFIDPIIKLKQPAPIVIEWLQKEDCPMWRVKGYTSQKKNNILSKLFKH